MTDKYELFNLSDVGRKRKRNEDYFASFKKEGWLLLLLCDGMGGVKGGREASRITVNVISEIFTENVIEPHAFFKQAVVSANQAVLNRAALDASLKGMGSTLVMVLFDDRKLYYAHVGDSRLYLLRANSLQQLTRDHSYINEMIDRGIIETSEVQTHKFKNRITRCIGQADSTPSICPKPIQVQEGDQFLLCSDGLTDMLDDRDIEGILNSSEHIEKATKDLIEAANQNGGVDNITVQLLHITNAPRYGIRIGMPKAKRREGLYGWVALIAGLCMIALIFGIPKIVERTPSQQNLEIQKISTDREVGQFLTIGAPCRDSTKNKSYNYFIPEGGILHLPVDGQPDTVLSAGPPPMPALIDCSFTYSNTYLNQFCFYITTMSDSLATFMFEQNNTTKPLSPLNSQYSVLRSKPVRENLLSTQDTIYLYFKHRWNRQKTSKVDE